MNLTVRIPDELAQRLGAHDDIERRALEAFAAEEYRAGRLDKRELRRLLDLPTRPLLDAFLKARRIYEPYETSDLDRGLSDLDQLGI